MTDNIATLDGFTEEYIADSDNGVFSVHLSVKPGTDLDGSFKAWDHDAQEYIGVYGWNWTFTPIAEVEQ